MAYAETIKADDVRRMVLPGAPATRVRCRTAQAPHAPERALTRALSDLRKALRERGLQPGGGVEALKGAPPFRLYS